MELLREIVSNVGSDEFYRASRYNTPLTVILINSDDKNMFDIIENNIRRTDIVQQLNSELIVVFLAHTNYHDAFLFIDKMKDKIDFTYYASEYKEPESEFIRNLFLDNIKRNEL